MKTTINLLLLLIFSFVLLSFSFGSVEKSYTISTNQTELDGKTLFNQKACTLCHSPEKVIVGPSLRQIAKTYGGDHKAILQFLSGQANPKVHPEEFTYMKPVLTQLKKMKAEEREAIAKYIASHQ